MYKDTFTLTIAGETENEFHFRFLYVSNTCILVICSSVLHSAIILSDHFLPTETHFGEFVCVRVREPCLYSERFLYGGSMTLYHCGTRSVEEPDWILEVSQMFIKKILNKY